jgi:hypothetical protein
VPHFSPTTLVLKNVGGVVDQPVQPAQLRETERRGARASLAPRYNVGTCSDRGLMYVSRWHQGEQTTVALVPYSRKTEEWARDFCAAQNQAPDEQRERAFVRRADALYYRYYGDLKTRRKTEREKPERAP